MRLITAVVLALTGLVGGCSIECNLGLGSYGRIDLVGLEGVYELDAGDDPTAVRLTAVPDKGEQSYYGMYWVWPIQGGEIQKEGRHLLSLHRLDDGYFVADIRPVLPTGVYGRHQFARLQPDGHEISTITVQMLEESWVRERVKTIDGARIVTPPDDDDGAGSGKAYLHVSGRASLVELLKGGSHDPDAFESPVRLRKTTLQAALEKQRAKSQAAVASAEKAESIASRMQSARAFDPARGWAGLNRVKLSFREIHLDDGKLFPDGARDGGVAITSGPRYDEVVRQLKAEGIRIDPAADVELRLRWIVETTVFSVRGKDDTFLTAGSAMLVDLMADGLVIRGQRLVRVRASIHDTVITSGLCEGPRRELTRKDFNDEFGATLRAAIESLKDYEASLSTLEHSSKIWREGQQGVVSRLKRQSPSGWGDAFMKHVQGPAVAKPLSGIEQVTRISASVGTNDWASNVVVKRMKLSEALEDRWRREVRVSTSARPAVSVYHTSYRTFIRTGRSDLAWEPKSDVSYARFYERGALVWIHGRPYTAVIGHEPVVEIDLGINSLVKKYSERDAMNARVIAALRRQAR